MPLFLNTFKPRYHFQTQLMLAELCCQRRFVSHHCISIEWTLQCVRLRIWWVGSSRASGALTFLSPGLMTTSCFLIYFFFPVVCSAFNFWMHVFLPEWPKWIYVNMSWVGNKKLKFVHYPAFVWSKFRLSSAKNLAENCNWWWKYCWYW